MDLLLDTLDLREVVASAPVAPLPGRSRGIQGVVFYQGEFLPVLAWEDLPGCLAVPGPSMALRPPGKWGEGGYLPGRCLAFLSFGCWSAQDDVLRCVDGDDELLAVMRVDLWQRDESIPCRA